MKAQLRFEERKIKMGIRGEETPVPDLVGNSVLQNQLEFYLNEDDEIFEAYGRCTNAYPYRQLAGYSRELKDGVVKTAVLENDYLRAEFLTEYGGRLWSFWDKTAERNLLYTNDVLRFSNLAIRNAWFSGGVEWNISMIGHTPFTTEPLFVATLEDADGNPVLRMYEYERVRQVTYQMDFWLGEHDRFLNVRIRIVNFGREVVPMYWWSNIAVPEHEHGRVIVPADKAYTNHDGGVYKVDIPFVDGIDVTDYGKIPLSVDYFFEIDEKDPKYIANVDKDGYGLLHMSTDRLKSRKLFSWGHKQGSDHWQDFLTEDAGRYVEIQAGIGKTQYGCIPMPPHTAWEWLERYGAVQLPEGKAADSFENLRTYMTDKLLALPEYQEMKQVLHNTKELAKRQAKVQQYGSGFGAVKNAVCRFNENTGISEHLDFGAVPDELKYWIDFLETGKLKEMDGTQGPSAYMRDEVFFDKLKETIEQNHDNWYAHYQLGILYFQKKMYDKAEMEFQASLAIAENPWNLHGMASLYTVGRNKKGAVEMLKKGANLCRDNLDYIKEAFRILTMNDGFQEIIEIYEGLDEELKRNRRNRFYYSLALYHAGSYQKAFDLLHMDGALVVDDVREGEMGIGQLWRDLHHKLEGEEGSIPYVFDFETSK